MRPPGRTEHGRDRETFLARALEPADVREELEEPTLVQDLERSARARAVELLEEFGGEQGLAKVSQERSQLSQQDSVSISFDD